MALKRNRRFHAEVATSSLSDIMFFLLLFFLIISTLANPNVIKMTLPKTQQNDKTNKQHITLSVSEEKQYYVDKQNVPFNELEAALLTKMGDARDQTVIVRIPYNLQVQDLVDLLQIGVKNNLKFVIATDKKLKNASGNRGVFFIVVIIGILKNRRQSHPNRISNNNPYPFYLPFFFFHVYLSVSIFHFCPYQIVCGRLTVLFCKPYH